MTEPLADFEAPDGPEDRRGDIQLSLNMGGFARITVSPTLKRLL